MPGNVFFAAPPSAGQEGHSALRTARFATDTKGWHASRSTLDELYRSHDTLGTEFGVFTFDDGDAALSQGTEHGTDSALWAAGDKDSDGSVTELTFAGHIHPGPPEFSSDDFAILAARARLNPARIVRHTVYGRDAGGNRAAYTAALHFSGGAWEYELIPSKGLPERLAEDTLIRLQCALWFASEADEAGLQTMAYRPAAAPQGGSQTLAETIVRVRGYFIENGQPEARVSLREVHRIRKIAEIYSPSQGLTRAVAKALWLTLCASLNDEQRKGPLGKGLLGILSRTVLPTRSGASEPTLKQELDRLSETRVLPIAIDWSKDIDTQLNQYREDAWKDAAKLAGFGDATPEDLTDVAAFSSPETAVELLAIRFAKTASKSDPSARTKAFAVCRAVPRLAGYLDGDEPVWMMRALGFYETAPQDPNPENRFQLALGLMELIPSLSGRQKEDATLHLMRILDKTPLIETFKNGKGLTDLRLNWLVRFTDPLDEPERTQILEYGLRELESRFDTPDPNSACPLPQAMGAFVLLAERLRGADRVRVLDIIAAKIQKIVTENPFNALDTLRRVMPAFGLFSTERKDALSGSVRAFLQGKLTPDNAPINLLSAAECWLAAPEDFPEREMTLTGRVLEAVQSILNDWSIVSAHEGARRLLHDLLPLLDGVARQKAADLFTADLNKSTQFSGDWLNNFAPYWIESVSGENRGTLVLQVFHAAEKQGKSGSPNNLMGAISALKVLVPYLGTDDGHWARFVALMDSMIAATAFDPVHEPAYSEMRGHTARALIAALPYMTPERATAIRNRLESAYLDYAVKVERLDGISLESLARVPADSPENGELLSNAKILAETLVTNDPRIASKTPLPVSPHFDRTLVTAHRLLNHAIQALTVNRFVLLTGPSGIGKSEAGRYLAEQLNWPSSVFNCNRATTREDMMQKVGIVLHEGASRFMITDGPLATALSEGKLFILNEINLAKPGNLAFLFSLLADIDDEFDFYDATTGRVERRPIHPNFRMLATQNPDGPGRKDLNAALKNRAIEIFTSAYSDVELISLLETKYPAIGEKYGTDAYQTLVAFHFNMRTKIQARVIGSHDEGYVWNLRHLMRLAEGFADSPVKALSARDVLRIFYDRVGVSLLPKDRAVFYDEVKNHVYQGTKVTTGDVEKFKTELAKLSYTDVFTEFGIDPTRGQDVLSRMRMSDIPTSARFLRSILGSFNVGYNVWLKGPAGTGKTRLAELAASLTGAELFSDTFTPQTDEAQLKGELKPRVFKLDDGSERLGFEHVPSALVRALREAAAHPEKRVLCLLDEAAFAKPDVLEELNSLIDRDGGLWVLSEDGGTIEFLERPNNFRMVLSSNTYGYSGVSLQSEALRSRTQEIFMDFEFTASEIDVLLGGIGGTTASPPDGRPPSGDGDQSLVPDSTDAANPAAPASTASTGTSESAVTTASAPTTTVPVPHTIPPPRAPFPGGFFGGKPPLIPFFGGHPAAMPTGTDHPTAELSFNDGIRQKLKASGLALSEEQISTIERRFDALKQRLRAHAVSMGRDAGIALEFDPAAKTASMTVGKPRTFRIGPALLLSRSDEELLGIAQHEGGHADITRMASGLFWNDSENRALWAAIEDLRVNARVMDRNPGRAEDYKAFLNDFYRERFDALKDGDMPELLPHEAFLNAVFSIFYDGKSAWQNDPVVGPALTKAWPGILKAMGSRPRELHPSEATVYRRFRRFEDILKTTVLPIYRELVERSREEIDKRNRSGGQNSDEGDGNSPSDGSGGTGSGSSGSRTGSKGQRGGDIIGERSKKISDALGSQDGVVAKENEAGDQNGNEEKRNVGDKKGDEKNEAGEKSQDPSGDEKSDPNDSGTDAFKKFAKSRKRAEEETRAYLDQNAYADLISPLSSLADRVFAVFDQLLKPNSDFEYDDLYSSGPRLDIERAIRAIHGMLSELNVFTRKSDPNGRDYRFSLLLDASGSMNNPERTRGGLGLAALFMDVFERLDIPYALDAFHNNYIPLKGFEKSLRSVTERNRFFNELKQNYWGKGGTAIRKGLAQILDRIREERKRAPRSQEFLFVLSDGDETDKLGAPIREQCEQAMKEGIIVVGIGIGDGMDMVRTHFPIHLVENDPANLPALISEFIKEYVRALEDD